MKFIQVGLNSHIRNEESFKRGCLLFNIEYQKVNSINEINNPPDLIWSTATWIDPSNFPKTKFIFGPQFFVFPDKNGPLMTCQTPDLSSRCYYNCLSEWNFKIHQSFAESPKVPYIFLPFGIDTDTLKPDENIEKINDVLIYYKNRHKNHLDAVIHIVKELNLSYKIINYGSYNINDYHRILKESKVCIWVGCHESQGFAFQEALSIGIPLLVYDVLDMKDEVNKNNISCYLKYSRPLLASSASYWDSSCGEKTTDPGEIKGLLIKMLANLSYYRPRDFVIKELSDTVCFKRLLNAFNL